jgi:hypothetical protein
VRRKRQYRVRLVGVKWKCEVALFIIEAARAGPTRQPRLENGPSCLRPWARFSVRAYHVSSLAHLARKRRTEKRAKRAGKYGLEKK